IGALDKEDIAAARATAQIAIERGVTANLSAQREALDRAAAPRHPHIEAAHRLAVEAGHRAEPHVEVEIARLLLADIEIGRLLLVVGWLALIGLGLISGRTRDH